ncbi:MAG: hypothetical protein RRA45_08295 [Saccharolobus sp.]|jgi:hypothetical protein|uniref:hypothetical protein n=1 Tax=Saccharolobus sp. TaxID=2100761 RepID=UPI0028CEBCB2|nr:hypothetical protein [Saccharolobus sp.]MDT7862197.1 hypothetical protein [Saccharolobus sp.]
MTPKIWKNIDKTLTIAKLEALMSLIQILSDDRISDMISGSILAIPLNRPIDDIIKYISDNWNNLKDLIKLLDDKIRKVDRITFLNEEIKISFKRINIENKVALVLLAFSSLLLFFNLIRISFLLSGLALGISLMSILTSLTSLKYINELNTLIYTYVNRDIHREEIV